MYQRLFPGDHPYVAAGLNNLAACLASLNRFAEAITKYEAALEMKRRIYRGDHPDLVLSLKNLAARLEVVGRVPDASAKWREAIAMQERLTQAQPDNLPLHLDLARSYRRFGDLLAASGDTNAAATSYQHDLRTAESVVAKDAASAEAVSLRRSFRADLLLEEVELSIRTLVPGGQAEKAGLQAGDVLTRYAGSKVISESQMRRLIDHSKGSDIELEARRGGRTFQVKVSEGKLGVTFAEHSLAKP
jgi:tetratricopeptide (TPR) repeat protein